MAESATPAFDPSNPPIVTAVDGSAISYQAVAWAAIDAELRCCPLHIVTSCALPAGYGFGGGLGEREVEWVRDDAQRVLTEATRIAHDAVQGDTISITTELTFELIIPTMIDRSRVARMVAVGDRGRGALGRAVLGSVSTALTRHAHCPVAVVHGSSQADAVSARKPVVVGVDGTANSMPAVEMAFEEASHRKVSLIAVHAWSDITGYDLPVPGWEEIRTSEEVQLAESLAGFGERFPDVPVERVVVCDRPFRSILEYAEGAQLVVVGSHGRGGFAGMMLGSTSTSVLHTAECPVIVVRER
ncbi:universal stress protein [Nocardia mexicana]|uniref:Nucleotide-binding universal stress UspA family protein n=1 Tax=Nocardia mexicana TaxID=279262 RepID=A0A370H4L1_9NOCA|nr:universal stress protein [Nocardia mexicana]RDI51139.1 nucleotide-binding universal stress UspA family protein [Nocardia mexicana]